MIHVFNCILQLIEEAVLFLLKVHCVWLYSQVPCNTICKVNIKVLVLRHLINDEASGVAKHGLPIVVIEHKTVFVIHSLTVHQEVIVELIIFGKASRLEYKASRDTMTI